ncbi:MAG: hypothetical protein BAA02_09370 [Paenibacillaceae bacterium ZCTH02-B3]|nr:MAG: hypothetical protein BAA02_09370 [Paenibacillaceae bacterium ZCTH02-B3]
MNFTADSIQLSLNFVWIILAGVLVFVMQAGFTLLEAGMTRAKHSINVAMKNVADIMVAILLFSAIGFPLMFGETAGGWIDTTGFFYSGMDGNAWNWAYMFFQIVFAGTAATIVSGAIAERARLIAYLIGTAIVTVFVYPVVGHWAWGGGLHPDQQGWMGRAWLHGFRGVVSRPFRGRMDRARGGDRNRPAGRQIRRGRLDSPLYGVKPDFGRARNVFAVAWVVWLQRGFNVVRGPGYRPDHAEHGARGARPAASRR